MAEVNSPQMVVDLDLPVPGLKSFLGDVCQRIVDCEDMFQRPLLL